jgi:hypothetical protein
MALGTCKAERDLFAFGDPALCRCVNYRPVELTFLGLDIRPCQPHIYRAESRKVIDRVRRFQFEIIFGNVIVVVEEQPAHARVDKAGPVVIQMHHPSVTLSMRGGEAGHEPSTDDQDRDSLQNRLL